MVGIWVTATFALIGVITGAAVSPWAARRQAWVSSQREALDKAIVATRKANLRRNYLRGAARGQLLPAQVGTSPLDHWPTLTDEHLDRAHDVRAQLPLDGFAEFRAAVVEMRDALAVVEPYVDLDWDWEREWLPGPDTFLSLLAQLKRARNRSGLGQRIRSLVQRQRPLP
ncbi:hypothetical protein [Streptomyces sp. NPDC055105]|uniref:hypothetical protein n=1 Tax=Streptomyces sp. NPDC055105 TaxID=3365719 RepID=UPI0037D54101